MSKLEQLIEELCPDGVEYKELGSVIISLKTGLNPRKNFILNTEDASNYYVTVREIVNGKIVFFDKTDKVDDEGLLLINNRSNLEKGDILFSGTGTVGRTAVLEDSPLNWNIKEGVYAIKPDQEIICSKYLGYILNSSEICNCYSKKIVGSPVCSLPMAELKQIKIPLPPLPVQEEIVRILDNFTELTAELTAELTYRKKQYEYYRDSLLSFGEEVEYKKIKDCFKRLKGTPITARKMKEIECEDGEIRVYAGGKTVVNAKEEDIPNANITRVPAVLVQSRGIIDVVYFEKAFTFKNEMWAYTQDEKVSVKYLYYVLKNNIQSFKDAASGMGSLPQISLRVTEEFIIPVPPLSEQQRIVDILDRFDTLCNDISKGLPAEIEERQKQYEYYRDKLLTFKKKEE